MYFGNLGTYIPRDLPFGNHPTLSHNLFVYWRMEETGGTRIDANGPYSLSPASGTAASVAGKNGNAAVLAGGSVYLSRASTIFNPVADLTLSMWVQFPSVAGPALVFQVLNPSNSRESFSAIVSGGFKGRVGNTDSVQSLFTTGGAAVSAGAWHHMFVEYNATTKVVSARLDNGAAQTAQLTGTVYTGSTQVNIGYSDETMYVDEVAVWGRVLTTDERNALYNGGTGLFY